MEGNQGSPSRCSQLDGYPKVMGKRLFLFTLSFSILSAPAFRILPLIVYRRLNFLLFFLSGSNGWWFDCWLNHRRVGGLNYWRVSGRNHRWDGGLWLTPARTVVGLVCENRRKNRWGWCSCWRFGRNCRYINDLAGQDGSFIAHTVYPLHFFYADSINDAQPE